MKKGTLIDAADVMRKAVFRIDDGWYDAYWYSERPAAKPRLLSRVIRQLGNAIAAIRVGPLGRPARRNTPTVTHPRAEDLMAAGEG
jgi:hypothetical protein